MLLIKFSPGFVLITVIQELATGGVKIEPFLHLVGNRPRGSDRTTSNPSG
jgi:hypothetical protein